MNLRSSVPAFVPTMGLLGALALSPLVLSQDAHAQGTPIAPDAAKTFVQQSGQQLVAVVNGGGSKADKAAKLHDIVDQDVAVDQIANFVLGRYIHVATPAQHQQYLALFHQLLSYNITVQISAYEGITFTVNSATAQGDGALVDSTITRPGQAPADVQWDVENVGGSPKIVDVIVAGTSLRVTERNDYASVITGNGGNVSTLLTAMQNQITKLKAAQS